jgi:hypothetical protein
MEEQNIKEKKAADFHIELLQDRRRLIELLSEIEYTQILINLGIANQKERKLQLNSEIKEKDQWGNIKTKTQLEREVELQEQNIKSQKIDLMYFKEDLMFLLQNQDLDEIKKKLWEHSVKIDNTYNSIKKKLGG